MVYQNPKILYRGKRVDLLSIEVTTSDGKVHQKEVVSHPGAVVILPFLDTDTILLIKNDRYVVQKTLLELPAGTLEKGEKPELCAVRELEEETGYRANKITFLFEIFSTPGFCNEKLFIYRADGLVQTEQSLDETETITVVPMKFSEAVKNIEHGIIEDAKTICALLYSYVFTNSKS